MSKMTKEEAEQYGKDWYELTHKIGVRGVAGLAGAHQSG